MRLIRWPAARAQLAAAGAALICAGFSGCAGVSADAALGEANAWSTRAGSAAPRLADALARADARRARLAQPLDEANAVALALEGSPDVQALLADGWALQQRRAADASWPRLGLAFERAAGSGGVAWTHTVSIGLAELIALPARRAQAQREQQASRLALAQSLLARHADVRQQWVQAVSARQQLAHHEQVATIADTAAEMARRLRAAGNWSALQLAREEAAALDAHARLSRARADASAQAEALIRRLGLTGDEAARLQWPGHLPPTPAVARPDDEIARAAQQERLDLQLAWAAFAAATGAPRWADALDAEGSWARERGPGDERTRTVGLAFSLPWPGDWLARAQARDASAQAAAARLEQVRLDAASRVRERAVAYRTAHALARTHREQLLPLRQRITQETLKRYNGMLASPFELFAEARAQAAAVLAAIEAERDFHLARVALDAELLGVPAGGATLAPLRASAEPGANAGH